MHWKSSAGVKATILLPAGLEDAGGHRENAALFMAVTGGERRRRQSGKGKHNGEIINAKILCSYWGSHAGHYDAG